jgi:hypothetical protein
VRVKTWVEIEHEVEVEVVLDDVVNEMCGLPNAADELKRTLNTWHALMSRIPDSLIAQLTSAAREIVRNALLSQAARYAGNARSDMTLY